jgi:hypothetical protein
MDCNVADAEKPKRLLGGAAAILLALIIHNSFLSSVLLIVGLVGMASGFLGYCPVYAAMGKNTKG